VTETKLQDQKLWLTLFQIEALKKRLNLLTAQFGLFSTLAVIIAGTALIYLAALAMPPLAFLACALVVVASALVATWRVIRVMHHRWANLPHAAMLADSRAGLKGRLLTVLATADAQSHSVLWPYLIEDTYAHRREFEPARIEPRWVSRAIFAFTGVVFALVAIAFLLRYRRPGLGAVAVMAPSEVTADLNDLEIEPADPALQPNVHVYADAATLRQLQSKLADRGNQARTHDRWSRWMSSARNFAGALQDQVTGHKLFNLPPLHLKLTNRGDAGADPDHSRQASSTGSNNAPPGPGGNAGTAPNGSTAPSEAPQLAHNDTAPAVNPPNGSANPNSADPGAAGQGEGPSGIGGATHSGGTDPTHLFGPPQPQRLGADSFKITIDATPADEASAKGAPAYIPPKIQVPLNPEQAPDEPIARAEVPPEDQMTIKRVFER